MWGRPRSGRPHICFPGLLQAKSVLALGKGTTDRTTTPPTPGHCTRCWHRPAPSWTPPGSRPHRQGRLRRRVRQRRRGRAVRRPHPRKRASRPQRRAPASVRHARLAGHGRRLGTPWARPSTRSAPPPSSRSSPSSTSRLGRALNYRGDLADAELHRRAASRNLLKAITARAAR